MIAETNSFCANCYVYRWEPPGDRTNPLKKCSGCWKISYCSNECQEEHWKKVHKRHCKFFSGKKSPDDTMVHNEDTCDRCEKQAAVGDHITKGENPNYICFFTPQNPSTILRNWQVEYPLPSEDSPRNQSERIIYLLQTILLKIMLTNQPVFQTCPREMKMIQHELLNMKAMYHLDSIVFPKNYNRVRKIANIQTLIKEAVQAGPAEGGGFQMWRTFLMVFDLFVFVKALEDEKMIKKHRKGFKKQGQLVREGSFPRIVDKILEVLEQQLVSQEDLATIACDGNLKRLCSTCNKNITVKGIISRTMLPACDKIILGMPTVLIRPGADNLFSCGARAGSNDRIFVLVYCCICINTPTSLYKVRLLFSSCSCQGSAQVFISRRKIMLK